MSTKELQQDLAAKMSTWQKVEDASVVSTGQIMQKTENPLIHMVMEIVQADSRLHHRVQGFIADSLTTKQINLNVDDLEGIWDAIEAHLALERKMTAYLEEALGSLSGKKMVVQEYLLQYLKADEEKHDKLLSDLSTIRKGMYPYG